MSIDARSVAANWIARFDSALRSGEPAAVTALLGPDSWWRDLLALTWDLRTCRGSAAIGYMLLFISTVVCVSFFNFIVHPARRFEG